MARLQGSREVLADTIGLWSALVVEPKLDLSYLILGKEDHPFYKHYKSVQRSWFYLVVFTIMLSAKLAWFGLSEISRASSDKDHEDFGKECQRSYHRSTSFI
jgi:hypothetical protein